MLRAKGTIGLKKISLAVLCLVTLCYISLDVWKTSIRIGPHASLANANLNGIELVGRDLHGADLSGASLRDAVLSGANLQGAKLVRANLEAADLSGADLTGAELDGAMLQRTDLTDAIGVTDDLLASALNVTLDDLPGILSRREIRLDSREYIIDSLKDVCLRRGVDEACEYAAEAGFHPVVLLDGDGEIHSWSRRMLEAGWEPMALRHCELVVLVEEQEPVVIETCPYILGPPIKRYQYRMNVSLYSSKTGEPVANHTFMGDPPEPCPKSAPVQKTKITGNRVSFEALHDWLSDYVNPP